MEFDRIKKREAALTQGAESMNNLPGRSIMPPPFQVTADEKDEKKKEEGQEKEPFQVEEKEFLCAPIGKDSPNDPADLAKLGKYLLQAGVHPFLVSKLMDPGQNGYWIERYQKEALGWTHTDGIAAPGGKTIAAILDLRGEKVVRSWFEPPKEKKKEEPSASKTGPESQSKKESSQGLKEKGTSKEDIEPLLSQSQFFSAFNQAGQTVPLSFLKSNMNPKSSETAYRNAGCYQTCRYMLLEAGFSPQGSESTKYMMSVKTNGKKDDAWRKSLDGFAPEAAESKSRLDSLLEAKIPVIIGVNRDDQNHRPTNSKPDGSISPTDHFVVVVGRKKLENGKTAYHYFDPGRYSVSYGVSPTNLLIQENDGIKGEGYDKFTYTLSEVRDASKK